MTLQEKLKELVEFDEQPVKEDWCGERAASDYNSYVVGVKRENARLKPLIDALLECVGTLKAEYPCDEHDMEPNTTMDFFRCDRCGIRPSLAEALANLEAAVKEME